MSRQIGWGGIGRRRGDGLENRNIESIRDLDGRCRVGRDRNYDFPGMSFGKRVDRWLVDLLLVTADRRSGRQRSVSESLGKLQARLSLCKIHSLVDTFGELPPTVEKGLLALFGDGRDLGSSVGKVMVELGRSLEDVLRNFRREVLGEPRKKNRERSDEKGWWKEDPEENVA